MTVDQFRREILGKPALKKRAGTVTLDMPLPPKVIHPNGRTRNHKYRAAMIAKARRTSSDAAMAAALAKPFTKATIQATFYLKRRMDGDNLNSWIKPVIDGLQGHIIANDSGVTLLPPEQITGKEAGEPRVVLTIKEAK
jgi:hypothetical protein